MKANAVVSFAGGRWSKRTGGRGKITSFMYPVTSNEPGSEKTSLEKGVCKKKKIKLGDKEK